MPKVVGFIALFQKRSVSEATTVSNWPSQSRKNDVETLWRDFFSDPSRWWDHRSHKMNLRFPDFKHKQTGKSLWLHDERNPTWLASQMASITPGTLQLNGFSWTQILSGYNKSRQYQKTLEHFEVMQQEGINANRFVLVHVIDACAGLKVLEEGKRIHRQILQMGCESDPHMGNSLVNMYAKCGSIKDAWKVFEKMSTRDLDGWTAMILGFVSCGQVQDGMNLFHQMQRAGVQANSVIFLGLLKACASLVTLEDGRCVHNEIVQSGLESDLYVGTSLVNMYAKCGSIEEAWRVFSKMPTRNVFGWTAMILGYVKYGQGQKALNLWRKMEQEGVVPDSVIFVGLLKACASLASLEEGRCVHEQIIQSGIESDKIVGSALVDMYAKCGSIAESWEVFKKIPEHAVVGWNSMILGYVRCGQGQKALALFEEMQRSGVKSNSVTFVGLVNACASLLALSEGRSAHEKVIQSGFESDIFVGSSLVDMYAKCGSIDDAWRVFAKMPARNVVSWTAIILGFVKSGKGQMALKLYRQMQQEGVNANAVTFLGLVNACASLAALNEGRFFHNEILRSGFESDIFVGSSLVDMYAKCGSIEDAWSVFNNMPSRNVVAWNAMILGYVNCGHGQKALELSHQMQQEAVMADSVTFVGMLKACATLGAIEEGRHVHEQIIRCGCQSNSIVGNSLIDMYVKCGSIEEAGRVFINLPTRNVVAWNAMILGYVKCGQGQNALKLSWLMQQEGVVADSVTFVGLLNACSNLSALDEGRCVHEQVIRSGCESDNFVGSSLVDMYAKCGSIEDASQVFNKIQTCNTATWNAMIGGYAIHGLAKEAVEHFDRMCLENVEIDEVTFVCLLSACSHGGLVLEGLHYFEAMSSVYGISPTVKHYACMVDLFGRANRLSDAEQMLETMPVKPDASLWMSLLNGCRIHGNMKMGERVAKRVLELDPENSTAYVLLSNTYAATGLWNSSEMVHKQRLDRGVSKQQGRTWIEVDNEVHSFVVGDSQHPQIVEIWAELKRLSEHMKEAGYIPDIRFAINDTDKEKKLFQLCHHSEKLAIAYGHMSTPAGATLHIVKNLRACGDCHTATKFISKIIGRKIIVRDTNRFHHFQDGLCSCGDYW